MNFPFFNSNVPTGPSYQSLRRYSMYCAQYSDFLVIYRPLTQELLKQGYEVIATKIIRWSSRSGWSLQISILANGNEYFSFYVGVSFPSSPIRILRHLTMCKKPALLTFHDQPLFFLFCFVFKLFILFLIVPLVLYNLYSFLMFYLFISYHMWRHVIVFCIVLIHNLNWL